VNAFVLAGGQSTRMGRDKALLELHGRPLVQHMLGMLCSPGFAPRICGTRSDLTRFAAVVPDNFPGAGPLGGLEAALALSGSELNLFVPVDLPAMPPEFLRWLAERAERSQAVATIPRCRGRLQPLCAVYSCRLLEGLRASLAAGRCKVMDAVRSSACALGETIDAFDVECIAASVSSERPLGPPAVWFRNVNTPGDYAALGAAGAALPLEQKRVIQ